MKIRSPQIFLLFILFYLFAGCQTPSALPTTTPTSAPTQNRTATTEPTPQPTSTPSPQPTATVAPPTVTSTTVPPSVTATQNVNVRSGPGTSFAVIGKMEKDKSALLTGKSVDEQWWQIAFPTDDERGWVSAQFTTVRGTTTSVAIVEIPTPSQSATPRPTSAPKATPTPDSVNLITFQGEGTIMPPGIYTIRPDGTDLRRLTEGPGHDQFPTWSPDGRLIAFSADRDGQNEIYIMNADGSNQHRIAPHSEEDLFPRWSHDGQLIAFHSTRDGKSIFVMNPDGSNVRKVITDENISFDYARFRLAWSPDDQRIAFTACDLSKGTCYLSIVNVDGSGLEQYLDANRPEYNWFESFSPDGRFQVVWKPGRGPQQIFIAEANTLANPRKLVDGTYGVWSPR